MRARGGLYENIKRRGATGTNGAPHLACPVLLPPRSLSLLPVASPLLSMIAHHGAPSPFRAVVARPYSNKHHTPLRESWLTR